MYRDDLPRIRTTVRVEHLTQPAHRGKRIGREDEIHVFDLVEPDAVFTRYRTARRDARRHDLAHRRVNPCLLIRIVCVVSDVRVEISVAGVKYVADRDPLAVGDLANGCENVRQARTRNHRILHDQV
jgi:hypothetical protein